MTVSPTATATCWPVTPVSASVERHVGRRSRYSIVAPESFFVGVTVTSVTVFATDAV